MEISNYNQTRSELGFGRVIKLTVLVDNNAITDEKTVKKAARAVTQILHRRDKKHPNADEFVRRFSQHVDDYHPVDYVDPNYPLIRNLIDKTKQFLFTGKEVDCLNKLGKEIGPAKGNQIGEWIKVATGSYFAAAEKYIKTPALRLKSKGTGNPLELFIYATGKGKTDSKNYKLIVDDIVFSETMPVKKAVSTPAQPYLFSQAKKNAGHK